MRLTYMEGFHTLGGGGRLDPRDVGALQKIWRSENPIDVGFLFLYIYIYRHMNRVPQFQIDPSVL